MWYNFCLLLGRKAMTNLDSILKGRDIALPMRVCIIKAVVFPAVMCVCESWTIVPKNWCFWTLVMQKTLESPLDCKEIKLILKEINPEYSLEGLMLKLKPRYFGHLMQRANSLEKTLMLGKIEGRRRRRQQRIRPLDEITDSADMSLGISRWRWRTGTSGVLLSLQLQRVGHNWVTKQH